jgi:Tfp pilus assembly protein PilO
MTMTKRERTLVMILLVLIVIGAYWLLFLSPYIEDMKVLKAQNEEKQTLLFNRSQQQLKMDELLKSLSDNEQKVAELSAGIAHGYDQPAILVYLEKTVKAHAVKQTFSFGETKQAGQMIACPVTVTMRSSYDGLKSVLSALADGEYFVKVTGLTAQQGQAEEVTTTETTEDGETVSSTTTQPSDKLNITLNLEFYSMTGDIPADTAYPFDSGHEFGGDVFK